jgi:hypothetical protein
MFLFFTVNRWLEIDGTVRFVLADDGCDVDEVTLQYLPSRTQLVALKPNEVYADVS